MVSGNAWGVTLHSLSLFLNSPTPQKIHNSQSNSRSLFELLPIENTNGHVSWPIYNDLTAEITLKKGGRENRWPEMALNQVSSDQGAPGWLSYIRDDTTELYRDYNKPL